MPAPDGAIERKLIDLRHPLSSLEARAQAGGDRAALDRIIDRRSVGDVDRGADIADRPLARDIADVEEGVDALCHARAGGERSEEHTSELQSLMRISYAVFCLK